MKIFILIKLFEKKLRLELIEEELIKNMESVVFKYGAGMMIKKDNIDD